MIVAAGARRRRRDDAVAAIVAVDRRRLADAVVREIRLGQDAAVGLRAVDDRRRAIGALVEGVGAALRDLRQRPGEIALDEPVAGLERLAVLQEDRRGGRVLARGSSADAARIAASPASSTKPSSASAIAGAISASRGCVP